MDKAQPETFIYLSRFQYPIFQGVRFVSRLRKFCGCQASMAPVSTRTLVKGPFTNYVTHFIQFFDHSTTNSKALAITLLMTHLPEISNSNAFANHPPTPYEICEFIGVDCRLKGILAWTLMADLDNLPCFELNQNDQIDPYCTTNSLQDFKGQNLSKIEK